MSGVPGDYGEADSDAQRLEETASKLGLNPDQLAQFKETKERLWQREREAEDIEHKAIEARLNATVGAKPSNPKDALGIKKYPTTTVSSMVMAEVGLGMLEGACKYGKHNYRVIGVRASIYVDATRRHIDAWWEGEENDPDSHANLNHVTKAIASLTVLRDAMIMGMMEDDRPPKAPAGWADEMNAKTVEILKHFPNPEPPYTEKNKHEGPRNAI